MSPDHLEELADALRRVRRALKSMGSDLELVSIEIGGPPNAGQVVSDHLRASRSFTHNFPTGVRAMPAAIDKVCGVAIVARRMPLRTRRLT